MIVVTGATGKLGRQIVQHLLEGLPADRVAVSARDPGKADDLARRGVRVRYGDFSKPDTLASAFGGASQLLIVSSNVAAYGGDPLVQHRTAIDAAQSAGVRRIVYTSHMGASASSAFRCRRGCGGNGGGVVSGLFNEPFRRWHAGGDHAMEQGSTTRDADGTGLFAGDAWFDPIEAGIRDRVRGFIQELLEQELTAALGRSRSERAIGELRGYRNGTRERQLLGSFGSVSL